MPQNLTSIIEPPLVALSNVRDLDPALRMLSQDGTESTWADVYQGLGFRGDRVELQPIGRYFPPSEPISKDFSCMFTHLVVFSPI